jgi:hypothetical protein
MNVLFSKWKEQLNAMKSKKRVNISAHYRCVTCSIFNVLEPSNTTFVA